MIRVFISVSYISWVKLENVWSCLDHLSGGGWNQHDLEDRIAILTCSLLGEVGELKVGGRMCSAWSLTSIRVTSVSSSSVSWAHKGLFWRLGRCYNTFRR
jgi:hypothetical protein